MHLERSPASGLRVAFFGLPLAATLLARDGHDLRLAVLSPVAGPGRRRLQRLLDPSARFVDLLPSEADDSPPEVSDDELVAWVREAGVDLLVSWFWTRRLPEAVLTVPPLGGIGAHPSLLPRHRGPNPFFAAIDAGDLATGVSIHRLTGAYDEGHVLATEAIRVGNSDAWQLARRLDRPSLRLLRATVNRMARREPLREVVQNEAEVTWAPEPTGDALRVDWTWSSARIARRVRALSPVPGLALEISGQKFFALEVEPTANFPAALLPGESAIVDDHIVIRSGDGAIRVLRAQLNLDDEDEEAGDGEVLRGTELAAWVARS